MPLVSDLRWRWLAVIAACAFALGALAGLLVHRHALFSLPGDSVASHGTALIGGPFSLRDLAGQRVTDRDFRNRPFVLTFGYMSDPAQTPATLQLISRALDRLGSRSEAVQVVFITLDPVHDTSDILAKYLSGFHSRLRGLTGTEDEIAAVAKAYKVHVTRGLESTQGNSVITGYDSLIFFMNSEGVYVSHATPDEQLEEVIHRLIQML